eukprot:8664055-Ditylum_brightwellii.AAC.1
MPAGGDENSQSSWMNPFDDLIQHLLTSTDTNNTPTIQKMIKEDIYLRTLDAIHDEIVNTTTNSTRTTAPMMMMNDTNIKDVIR